jgi:hypothetical protein
MLSGGVSVLWPLSGQAENATLTVSRAQATSIDSLAKVFVFQDDARVRAFLRERPHLVGLLIEALPQVHAAFGVASPVILDVVRHWEPHSRPELYARIRTTLNPIDALDALERFDRRWWLGALNRAHNELTFTVKLV